MRFRFLCGRFAPKALGEPHKLQKGIHMLRAATLNLYEKRFPSPSNAADLFAGQWISEIPGYGLGSAKLFDDDRIKWFEHKCGTFRGMKILELGPYEGGHTYMMAQRGADVLAIEANSNSFLKCLTAREMLDYRAKFLLGDFLLYLDNSPSQFDFLLCSGVLYHMADPLRLLSGVMRCAKRIGIWTHYYDRKLIVSNPATVDHFADEPVKTVVAGKSYELWPQAYKHALERNDFAGSGDEVTRWMTREGIIGFLDSAGFRVSIGGETPDHPHGPCILLYAEIMSA
jgi:SAM-dependent methyltransferase